MECAAGTVWAVRLAAQGSVDGGCSGDGVRRVGAGCVGWWCSLACATFEDMAVQVGLLGHDGRDRIMGRGQDGARVRGCQWVGVTGQSG